MPGSATDPAVAVITALVRRGETVASCESLTGGLLGATLTGVPGASAAYRGGLITYATELKHRLAGVDERLLARSGAVSAETAAAMAAGAAERCGADWGLATTGVAGPDRQEGHPPGTVFVAIAAPVGDPEVERLTLTGNREAVRRSSVVALLERFARRLG